MVTFFFKKSFINWLIFYCYCCNKDSIAQSRPILSDGQMRSFWKKVWCGTEKFCQMTRGLLMATHSLSVCWYFVNGQLTKYRLCLFCSPQLLAFLHDLCRTIRGKADENKSPWTFHQRHNIPLNLLFQSLHWTINQSDTTGWWTHLTLSHSVPVLVCL